MSSIDEATLMAVMGRRDGLCLRGCGQMGQQVHHRLPRGMGGSKNPKINEAPNLVWIDEACHREIESRRSDAFKDGWLVRRGADPEQQMLVTLDHYTIVLLGDGYVISEGPYTDYWPEEGTA